MSYLFSGTPFLLLQADDHRALIPLVESALALMRLSCEKFFVLLSLFVVYLIFREPPAPAIWLVQMNGRLSNLFQRVILYSFPAVCWIYGAGFIFSTFVSGEYGGRAGVQGIMQKVGFCRCTAGMVLTGIEVPHAAFPW
jgi:hypothetical protein